MLNADEERVAVAQKWIRENLTKSPKVGRKYTHYQIKNIIERDIRYYLSNDDVLQALINEGYRIEYNMNEEARVNVPTKELAKYYIKFGWDYSRGEINKILGRS